MANIAHHFPDRFETLSTLAQGSLENCVNTIFSEYIISSALFCSAERCKAWGAAVRLLLFDAVFHLILATKTPFIYDEVIILRVKQAAFFWIELDFLDRAFDIYAVRAPVYSSK